MAATRIHLVRHGEVFNPSGVLYGRLPNFHLSERGQSMAAVTAAYMSDHDFPVTSITVSPLERAQESAQPIAELYGVTPFIDERVTEAANQFEGKPKATKAAAFMHPTDWRKLVNPLKPSWGEPYQAIVDRMMLAIAAASDRTESGDAVIVSHQLPIWMVHRYLTGERLFHDPRTRRCALSSITTLEPDSDGNGFHEVAYADPNAGRSAIDTGAV